MTLAEALAALHPGLPGYGPTEGAGRRADRPRPTHRRCPMTAAKKVALAVATSVVIAGITIGGAYMLAGAEGALLAFIANATGAWLGWTAVGGTP